MEEAHEPWLTAALAAATLVLQIFPVPTVGMVVCQLTTSVKVPLYAQVVPDPPAGQLVH